MIIILTLITTICAAIMYRGGGQGTEPTSNPTWMPMWLRKTWIRDWMIPLSIYALVAFVKGLSLWQLAAIVTTGLAMTTYWDELFGYDNFFFAGFMVGLGAFPLFWMGIHWYWILSRAILLAILWGGWCEICSKDTTEEFGRGAFIAVTLPLLFI